MKFEYWKSATDHQWYWHLKAANEEKIAGGEGYTTKEKCLYVIGLVQASKEALILER
ncbi:MAG: hypothetical protein JWM88_2480 [Verrucomicrobia bacterium]|nr:hypothetical protein [Verrucomicrobiota bacterium]